MLEIGCGVGYHPLQWALANADKKILAFERTTEKYEKAQRRFLNHGSPENLLIVHGDVQFFASSLFGTENTPLLLDGIFVLYPNPYPKLSQANHRLAGWSFLPLLTGALRPKGFLQLATNRREYLEEAIRTVPMRTRLAISRVSELPADGRPRTHFEKKYLARQEPCWDAIFESNS